MILLMEKRNYNTRSIKLIPLLSVGLVLLAALWYLVSKDYVILKW
ncbi:hypothetical protein SAMN05421820_107410 [Pedobacter steynii]|uniref:Uncharacterized protein n=1 Tax=Pedobacter steynii TaxID=430522 RepID=A0A1H0BH15_9SPHI|nr:hypothetical protein SAMN05421820_107410 [Pedobacter steynii]